MDWELGKALMCRSTDHDLEEYDAIAFQHEEGTSFLLMYVV